MHGYDILEDKYYEDMDRRGNLAYANSRKNLRYKVPNYRVPYPSYAYDDDECSYSTYLAIPILIATADA